MPRWDAIGIGIAVRDFTVSLRAFPECDEKVDTKAMLDAYVSEAKEENVINAVRFAALVHATGDLRLLSVIPELFGQIVVPAKYQAAIEDAMIGDQIEELERRKRGARRQWKGGR